MPVVDHQQPPGERQRVQQEDAPFFFFFTDPPPTEIYPLSLHDALPIGPLPSSFSWLPAAGIHGRKRAELRVPAQDRKSTRLNSSHGSISYAVFCLKKKSERLRGVIHNSRPL